MSLLKISPGSDAPKVVNVIIEIPAQSGPIKYELDKETGTLHVDRILNTSMVYPANYGYIPGTLAEDGDPADVLVLSPIPLLSGSVIRVRPIALLGMTDEAGDDAKILAVPISKIDPQYDRYRSINDVPNQLLDTIAHFFQHYKDLEPNKWVKLRGWQGTEAAHAEIDGSIERAKQKG